MAGENRVGIRPLAAAWAFTAAAFVARAQLTAATTPLILDTDDAMRLNEVHDFVSGQGWYDLVQHRLNTPWGGEIHWSRLVDLPEALLLVVLRPIFGASADTALAYAWPLILLVPLLWLIAKLALRLGERAALLPALLLPVVSLIVMAEFAPGRIDHHSAQILLTLAMTAGAVAALERAPFAAVSGLAAAIGLAIGIEGLPMAAAAVTVLGLMWVSDARHATTLRIFGTTFAGGMVLALVQGVPPARWLTPMFDGISIVYAAAAVLCGVALLALSLLRLRSWRARLMSGLVAGAVVVLAIVSLWPGLLKGPYGALDPWLIDNWIDRISEAEPWLVSLASEPVYPIAVMVPVLTALIVTSWNVVRVKTYRSGWLVYGAFLVIATGVMLLQIRAARIAVPLAIPACAALVGAVWLRARDSLTAKLALVGSWTVSAGIAVAFVATLVVLAFPDYADATSDKYREARQACLMPAAFANLAQLPPQRIMAPIDLGSHLLLFTPHSVVAAPYHRNGEAVLDAFRFFNGPIEDGRKILAARGVTLVVICPAMKEIRGLVDFTADSFVALYAEDRLPPWLVEQSSAGSPLKVYAIAGP